MDDTYKTIAAASGETLFKEKNSKFFGYAFAVTTEEEVRERLDSLRKKHTGAGHFCYAFQIGTQTPYHRVNDDGEPSNSAGAPIFGQIQSFGLTNVLVVVVRFFGGVKLGVGGLISAYRTSAQMAIAAAPLVERTVDMDFAIFFQYKDINKAMRIIREKQLEIVAQKMELDCELRLRVRKRDAQAAMEAFGPVFGIEVKSLE